MGVFDGELAGVDPLVDKLITLEEERQARRLIMIPSESICHPVVRRTMDSVFGNLYAEGYPSSLTTFWDEERLSDIPAALTHYRRYADRRFYKGTDLVNVVELLCQRRAAELFANENAASDEIFANVQALSGAAANMAVEDAFLDPGDTILSMDLMQGGHLSHGSEFHISGRRYRIVSYGVDTDTHRIDYDRIEELAMKERPKLILAGYTSYPWAPDWDQFREIADKCGAVLMADIAHPAGMVIGGVYPNPVGIADVTTFTTHKTLMGPRGAVILTTDPDKAAAVDAAVFPGEQGGPHVNTIAALAVALKIAATDEFKDVQRRIVSNAKHFARALQDAGLSLAYDGTDTHLLLIDLKPLPRVTDEQLSGEVAVRILELCGIVANKNTIPGDTVTALATGVRMGTPWLTQRGITEKQLSRLAVIIADILRAIHPYHYDGQTGPLPRGKLEFAALEKAKRDVAELVHELDEDQPVESASQHYNVVGPDTVAFNDSTVIRATGERAEAYMQNLVTSDLAKGEPGDLKRTLMLDADGNVIDDVVISRIRERDGVRDNGFYVVANPERALALFSWMRGHADGYLMFDRDDITAKVEGPIVVDIEDYPEIADAAHKMRSTLSHPTDAKALVAAGDAGWFDMAKPYFVGQKLVNSLQSGVEPGEEFLWEGLEGDPKRTPLYEEHAKRTKKLLPFAGWEMPVWYGSALEEHKAVRETCALFDVAHMGVFEISGPHAEDFIDLVTTNYARWIKDGESFYGFIVDPGGHILDDTMVYRLERTRYLMVVNAANEDQDWAWLDLVNSGKAMIDRDNPHKRVTNPAVLRDLKDPASGFDCKVDLALQGPQSRNVLMKLVDPGQRAELLAMARTAVGEFTVAGISVVLSRTGYTGEEMGFEIFVHPDKAAELWRELLQAGAEYGIQPAGLAARDSARTEAGLPLYGHEIEGPHGITPGGASFGSYVKFHKPFFIGKKQLLAREKGRDKVIVRFAVTQKGMRPVKPGDPLMLEDGSFIGYVASSVAVPTGGQIGLAYVDSAAGSQGPVTIFPLSPAQRNEGIIPVDKLADATAKSKPVNAEIVERFPLRVAKPPTVVRTESQIAIESAD